MDFRRFFKVVDVEGEKQVIFNNDMVVGFTFINSEGSRSYLMMQNDIPEVTDYLERLLKSFI